MKHIARLFLFIALLVGISFSHPPVKSPAWVEKSNQNAQLVLKVLAKFGPESAGRLGVDGFDEEIFDLSAGFVERQNKALAELLTELNSRLPSESDPNVRQDLEILIKSVKDNIRGNDLGEKYQIPYYNAPEFIFQGIRALLDDQIAPERYKAALVRLRRYTGMESGYQPVCDLARGRTQEHFSKPGLLGPVKAEVEKGLANSSFYIDGIGDLLKKYKITGYEEVYAKLKEQVAAYEDFLRKELLPKSREDFRLPPELYAYSLEQVGVDIPPAELAQKAHEAFNSIQQKMQGVAKEVAKERGWTLTDYRDVMRELKKDQLVGDTILTVYKARIKDIEKIIWDEHLVTLPDREMRIRIASPAEAAQTPAPNMRPPRLLGNTGEMGEFVLPLNVPAPPGAKSAPMQKMDDFTFAAAAWTLTAHEGRPGHEMQFASIVEKGVSTTRAVFAFNSVNVEGWGLYSEAIMYPFMPVDGKLISLKALLQRAARAFLDPELQMGKITREGALKVLKDDVGLSDAMANQEVERYTFRAPGQATSYFYGYTRLMELREEMEKKLGGKFNQQQFHDYILAQGLLPPSLLRKAVVEHFTSMQ